MSELSANRTVVIVPPWQAAYAWPPAEIADNTNYGLDVTAWLVETNAALSSISVNAAPSGAGEIVISSVAFSGSLITAVMSGGVSGRNYIVQFVATANDAQVFVWFVQLLIDPALSDVPVPLPPAPGYGTPVVYP